MRSYHEQLQIHALNDLTNRAKSGVMTYLFVWLLLAFSYDLQNQTPEFFIINTCILVLIFLARLAHYFAMKRGSTNRVAFLNQWLVITVLAAAAHWGGMAGWIMYDDNLIDLRTIMLLTIPAFGLGGSCTLSISSEIRSLYPSLMFIPVLVILIHKGSMENLLIAALLVVSLLYIFSSSRASHNDYWEAITNHMVAEERAELMEKLSTTDQLTQLKNRMFFDIEYAKEWKRSSRLKCPLSVIMIDLDFFKKINDNYGHMFGDECLKSVAAAISKEAKRPSDIAARYGGEEFVVMLPNTDDKGTRIIAERIREAVAALSLRYNDEEIRITCSIGGATCIPNYKGDRAELIRFADSALYHAKNSGRNRYHASDETLV